MKIQNSKFKIPNSLLIIALMAFFWFWAGQQVSAACIPLGGTDQRPEGCNGNPCCPGSNCQATPLFGDSQGSNTMFQINCWNISEGVMPITGIETDTQESKSIIAPQLQVQIPGFQGFTTDESKIVTEQNGKKSYSFPWIGEYLIALYKWAIRLIAALAVVMIMWAGVEWMISGGNSSRISDAKGRI
ncbi:MAG: hypothetical protein PHE59_04465, partial [Patescibacteria group bacterium]|nr:hypothetical protein [Patescibacteria group bacterium]